MNSKDIYNIYSGSDISYSYPISFEQRDREYLEASNQVYNDGYDKTLLQLGRQGEHLAHSIEFDYTEWVNQYGIGALSLIVKRNGDINSYPVLLSTSIEEEKNIAKWDITSIDTEKAGKGLAELQYSVDDKIVRSQLFETFVYSSIADSITNPPDPYVTWVNTLITLGNTVGQYVIKAELAADKSEEFANKAEIASEHYPYINDDVQWVVWDVENEEWVNTEITANGIAPHIGNNGHWYISDTDTGINAQGPKGDKGNEAVINGYNTVQIVEGQNVTLNQIGNILTISAESGTFDHKQLINRDEPNSHPISAISGLEQELNNKQNSISDLNLIRDGANKGNTAVQPEQLNNYSTTTEMNSAINNYHDDSKQDVLESGNNIKTINGKSLLGNGNIQLSENNIDDILINNNSIIEDKIANIIYETELDDDSNNAATTTAIRAFVNASINSVAAYYITSNISGNSFSTYNALSNGPYYYAGQLRTPTRNDYAIVKSDETHDNKTSRYTYTDNQWAFQYTFNMEFTQAQIDTLNSGINNIKVALYDAHLNSNNNPHTVTKSQIGLSNVVNTGDSGTPVSGGTTKFTTGGAYTELNKKVDKTTTVNNKALSGNISITKSDVGLGNVDNTSDANKPVSTAVQTELNKKQNTLSSGVNIKTINNNSILGSGNINIDEINWGNITGDITDQADLKSALDSKISSIQSELSPVIPTVADNLNGIAQAEVGQMAIIKEVDSLGMPTKWEAVDVSGGSISDVKVNGASVVTDGVAEVPIAETNSYGVTMPNAYKGIYVDGNKLVIKKAENWAITSRLGYGASAAWGVIGTDNIDSAVEAALGDGKGPAWSEAHQAAAQERLGIYSAEGVTF